MTQTAISNPGFHPSDCSLRHPLSEPDARKRLREAWIATGPGQGITDRAQNPTNPRRDRRHITELSPSQPTSPTWDPPTNGNHRAGAGVPFDGRS
jgi:hypothetical protein